MIADGSGCHDMKYLIQRAYAAGKGHQYIRLLQDDILAVAQVVCGDYLIGVCTYFAVSSSLEGTTPMTCPPFSLTALATHSMSPRLAPP